MAEKKRKYRLLPGKKFRTYEDDGVTPRDLEPGDTIELSDHAVLAFSDAFEIVGKAVPPPDDDDADDESDEDDEDNDDGDGEEVSDEADVSEDATDEPIVEKKKKKKKKKNRG
jgi:hypothetical protein